MSPISWLPAPSHYLLAANTRSTWIAGSHSTRSVPSSSHQQADSRISILVGICLCRRQKPLGSICYGSLQNWVTELSVWQLSPVSVMTPIANCSTPLLATINTCCICSSPWTQASLHSSLFVHAVTTFNFLIAHQFSETKTLLWEWRIVMHFIDNSVFSRPY